MLLPHRLSAAGDALRPFFKPRGVTLGDHLLYQDGHPQTEPVEAAVLIALLEREGGWRLLLTERAADLSNHAGQVSFPGGRRAAEDADALETAAREAEEETGLPRHNLEPLGELDRYVTRTGFEITPVVALATPPSAWQPQAGEVSAIFEMPLSHLLANPPQLTERVMLGALRRFYELSYGDHYIWGATAGLLKELHDRLQSAPIPVISDSAGA